MRFVLVLSCINCGAGGVACSAPSTNQLLRAIGEPRAAVWTISPSGDGRRLLFNVECSGVSLVTVEGGFSVHIPGQAASAKPGTPDVPCLSRLLPGIKGARASLTVRGYDPTNLMNVAVSPAQGFRLDESVSRSRELRPYRQAAPDVYGKDQYWPAGLGSMEEGAIGTQQVVRVVCFPVQFNPVQGTVRFFRRLEGEIQFESK